MADRHKGPLLGWHPPAALSARAREVAERRGGRGALSDLLTEALTRELDRIEKEDSDGAEVLRVGGDE
jgi:hypothetical protein